MSCIHAAHTKYESNPADWQRVVEIGGLLLTKQDMERFEEMCKDGLLGCGNYGLFKDWLNMNRLRDGYIRIRDGLVLEEEIQEIIKKENSYNDGPYQARVCSFFMEYHPLVACHWWLLFHPTDLECYHKFEVSLERVMFITLLLVFFLSNGWIF
jgi:hypothetical protein